MWGNVSVNIQSLDLILTTKSGPILFQGLIYFEQIFGFGIQCLCVETSTAIVLHHKASISASGELTKFNCYRDTEKSLPETPSFKYFLYRSIYRSINNNRCIKCGSEFPGRQTKVAIRPKGIEKLEIIEQDSAWNSSKMEDGIREGVYMNKPIGFQ